MSGPNEPRLMKPRRDDSAHVFTTATGNPARDGYTRIAGRDHPSNPEAAANGPFGFGGVSDQIKPDVGQRINDHGPRFSDDF